jgi:hypothetical protein
MRHTGIYILVLLALVVLLGSLSIACGAPTSPTQSAQASATATPTNTTAGGGTPTQTTGGGGQTPTTTPTGSQGGGGQTPTGTPSGGSTSTPLPGGLPEIAGTDSLSSYRMSVMSNIAEGTGAGIVTTMKYEFNRDQDAEHAWMEDANGTVTEVYIKIGDQYWIWMYGLGWIVQPPQETQPSDLPSDLASQLEQAQQDVANSKARFDKKGEETVNDVHCIRYEFEYTLTIDMPNPVTGGTTTTEMHASGEMWIADESGVPAVMIKSVSTSEITMSGETMVVDSEQNITDIGADITINPPEDAMQPPG